MNKIVTYDKLGNKIGLQTRKNVHTKGFWHKGIQLNIYCHGKILIQKRSAECDSMEPIRPVSCNSDD